jgi:hypothetical protein
MRSRLQNHLRLQSRHHYGRKNGRGRAIVLLIDSI